jgi:hypothetical protein
MEAVMKILTTTFQKYIEDLILSRGFITKFFNMKIKSSSCDVVSKNLRDVRKGMHIQITVYRSIDIPPEFQIIGDSAGFGRTRERWLPVFSESGSFLLI